MGRIITAELINDAIVFARPSILEILSGHGYGTTWGPNWVKIIIEFEGSKQSFQVGDKQDWNPEWGEEVSFSHIAMAKLDASSRTDHPTRHLVHTAPHLLREGEYLYVGSVTWEGITVAVSGAKSAADEAIALVVLAMIKMLIFLEAERRLREGEDQI